MELNVTAEELLTFDFIGGSSGAAETEAVIYGVQHAIDNQTPFVFSSMWWWAENV